MLLNIQVDGKINDFSNLANSEMQLFQRTV